MTTQAAKKLDDNLDAFADAFNDDTLGATPPAETPPAETPPAETPPAATATPPAETPPAATATPPVETPPAATATPPVETPPATATPPVETPPAATATPPAATTSPDVVALQAQVKQLTDQLATLQAAPASKEKDEAAKKLAEDLTWLEGEFKKDWPDIARAIQVAVQSALGQTDGKIKNVTDAVTPIVQQEQARAFYTELQKLVPDVEVVRDGFLTWVNAQPPGLAAAYKSIVEKGTPAETAALINTYKQVQNIQTQTPTPPPPSASDDGRLTRMEDLGSRQTATTHSSEAQDFDGAFKEAANNPAIR